jgi:hypothetical protein
VFVLCFSKNNYFYDITIHIKNQLQPNLDFKNVVVYYHVLKSY